MADKNGAPTHANDAQTVVHIQRSLTTSHLQQALQQNAEQAQQPQSPPAPAESTNTPAKD